MIPILLLVTFIGIRAYQTRYVPAPLAPTLVPEQAPPRTNPLVTSALAQPTASLSVPTATLTGIETVTNPVPTNTRAAVPTQPVRSATTEEITQTPLPVPTETFVSTQVSTAAFAIGQQVIVKPPFARDLWLQPVDGERVFSRPRLYSGALVTVMTIEDMAVQVRTPEGVEGWIHSPAEEVLTAELNLVEEQAGFTGGARIEIVWPNGIPLRTEPRPDAPKLREQVKRGEGGMLQEVRGDWLLVVLDGGMTGWARWYYDGNQYIDIAPP